MTCGRGTAPPRPWMGASSLEACHHRGSRGTGSRPLSCFRFGDGSVGSVRRVKARLVDHFLALHCWDVFGSGEGNCGGNGGKGEGMGW